MRKERLDIRESLKCFGFVGECLRDLNVENLAASAGSTGSLAAGGMPQSFRGGISGGRRALRSLRRCFSCSVISGEGAPGGGVDVSESSSMSDVSLALVRSVSEGPACGVMRFGDGMQEEDVDVEGGKGVLEGDEADEEERWERVWDLWFAGGRRIIFMGPRVNVVCLSVGGGLGGGGWLPRE